LSRSNVEVVDGVPSRVSTVCFVSVPATMSVGLASIAWKPFWPTTGAQALVMATAEMAAIRSFVRSICGACDFNKVFDLTGPEP